MLHHMLHSWTVVTYAVIFELLSAGIKQWSFSFFRAHASRSSNFKETDGINNDYYIG
jgi:hypothetical protein